MHTPEGNGPKIEQSAPDEDGLAGVVHQTPSSKVFLLKASGANSFLHILFKRQLVDFNMGTDRAMIHGWLLFTTLVTAIAIAIANAKPTQGPAVADYVIVGGGPAGFVLAEYLTRQRRVDVVLLEAGPDSSTDPLVTSKSRGSLLAAADR